MLSNSVTLQYELERIRGTFCDDALYKFTFTFTFRGHSRSLTMAPFDRSHTSSC